MDKKIVIFDKTPKPKTVNEHEEIQKDLLEREKEEHINIEAQKGIDVLIKYKEDNEFILSALQERCQDYRETCSQLEENIK